MIGTHVAGYSNRYNMTQIFLVTLADSDNVIVANIRDATDIKALSPRAIGRTFHPAEKQPDGRWHVSTWGTYYDPATVEPAPDDTDELESAAAIIDAGPSFYQREYQALLDLGWNGQAASLQQRLAEQGVTVG